MPNPIRALRRKDKLSPRQKAIVKAVRKAKLPVRVYQRGRGISVHNPFLDVKRKAKVNLGRAKRSPQAFDTKVQRGRIPKRTRAKKYLLP